MIIYPIEAILKYKNEEHRKLLFFNILIDPANIYGRKVITAMLLQIIFRV